MTRNRVLMTLPAAALLLAAACAQVCVKPSKTQTSGYRYYLPRPYVLVTSDTAQIVWLPDLQQQYTIDPKPGLGALECSIVLTDGWMLTSANTPFDSKVPELVDKLTSMVTTLIPPASTAKNLVLADDTPRKPDLKPFGLYRLIYDATGSYVTELQPLVIRAPGVEK